MTTPIQTIEEHEKAIRRLEELMTETPKEGAPEDLEIISLGVHIETFEKKTFPI